MPNTANADETADHIISDYCSREGVTLHHESGDRAFYRPATDSITLPHMAQFAATAEYYSTAFHELTHSTGHKSRLDRLNRVAAFGSEDYSKEELIAEIGAAALVNVTGLETSGSFRNSAAYIQNWLQVLKDGIDHVAVAYRNNHPGKSNVHFSFQALNFIRKCQSCFIMIGDFTSFFDNLNHSYLKERLCNLLSVSQLPEDYYAVYKNITRFSYVDMNDLLDFHHLERTEKGKKALNEKRQAATPQQLHQNKGWIKKNPNAAECKGVPQGSPISAVLANIYMLKADKEIYDYALARNGFYMRYSDDFILVIPDASPEEFRSHFDAIQGFISAAGAIELREDKTKFFRYENQTLVSCTSTVDKRQENGKNILEFLGFAFDGTHIRLRDKTISKYYNRAYRKARTIAKYDGLTSKGTRASGSKLYKRYSMKGSVYFRKEQRIPIHDSYGERNFLDYLHGAKKVMQDELMDCITPRHMGKIKKKAFKKSEN